MSTTDTAPPPSAKKRMRIFRSGAGEALSESMPLLGFADRDKAAVGRLMQASPPGVDGNKVVVLFRQPGEDGMSLTYGWFKSGYMLPRHSHNADCIYYMVAGSIIMGTQTLEAGDGVFIPSDAAYTFEAGPDGVELLEFRNAPDVHFHLRDNDDAHWEKVINARATRSAIWIDEVPPSQLQRAGAATPSSGAADDLT